MLRTARGLLNDQSVRFVMTGGGAAALFYGLTFLLIRAGVPVFSGTVSAYVIAFAMSYTLQHRWTFRGRHRHSDSLPRYLAAQALCAFVSATVAKTASVYGAPPLAVSLAATLIAAALSYSLSRFWVFANRT